MEGLYRDVVVFDPESIQEHALRYYSCAQSTSLAGMKDPLGQSTDTPPLNMKDICRATASHAFSWMPLIEPCGK